MISRKSDTIASKAFKLHGMISAKDIVSSSLTESYHSGVNVIPFSNLPILFSEEVFAKGILVAEENFGFGSSNEFPAISLKKSGVLAIIAKSFFPCFYKNAFNIGLLCVQANTDYIDDNDQLIIDLEHSYIRNKTKLCGIKFQPIKPYFLNLYYHDGLMNTLFKKES